MYMYMHMYLYMCMDIWKDGFLEMGMCMCVRSYAFFPLDELFVRKFRMLPAFFNCLLYSNVNFRPGRMNSK